MCFNKRILYNTLHLEPKIATRPIRVLKIGYAIHNKEGLEIIGFVSPEFYKYYTINKVYTQPINPKVFTFTYPCKKRDFHYIEINRGFHSYRFLRENPFMKKEYWEKCMGDLPNKNCRIIGIFEIPVGSIYYSTEELFVSDSIKFIKGIETFEEWAKEDFKPELIL